MPLEPGTTLGPYEILSPIGAGGMGEVYKARDTRLNRTVAIKVLPEHVASDPDLKQRFEREAKTISSLNLTPCKPRSAVPGPVGSTRRSTKRTVLLGEAVGRAPEPFLAPSSTTR